MARHTLTVRRDEPPRDDDDVEASRGAARLQRIDAAKARCIVTMPAMFGEAGAALRRDEHAHKPKKRGSVCLRLVS